MSDEIRRGPGRPRKEIQPPEPAPIFDTRPVKPIIRRLDQAALNLLAPWLVPLLQEQFGVQNQTIVNGWLRMWMLENQFNIACSDHAVGLAQIVNDPMDPTPIVEEVFTFCQPGFETDGIEIYRHFEAWGKLVHATEFRFEKAAGARKELLKEAFPRFKWRSICYLEL